MIKTFTQKFDFTWFFISLLCFVLVLPFSLALVSIFGGVILFAALIEDSWNNKITRLKQNKVLAIAGYTVFIGIVFVLMPPNPDEITAPMDLVNGFRAMSVVAVSVFWVSVAVILGSFWHKFRLGTQIPTAKNQ